MMKDRGFTVMDNDLSIAYYDDEEISSSMARYFNDMESVKEVDLSHPINIFGQWSQDNELHLAFVHPLVPVVSGKTRRVNLKQDDAIAEMTTIRSRIGKVLEYIKPNRKVYIELIYLKLNIYDMGISTRNELLLKTTLEVFEAHSQMMDDIDVHVYDHDTQILDENDVMINPMENVMSVKYYYLGSIENSWKEKRLLDFARNQPFPGKRFTAQEVYNEHVRAYDQGSYKGRVPRLQEEKYDNGMLRAYNTEAYCKWMALLPGDIYKAFFRNPDSVIGLPIVNYRLVVLNPESV
jgi:hypothetical protein